MAQEPQHQAAGMGYAEFGNMGMQVYEPAGGHDLYSLQTRMEMLGLPSKHHQHHHNSPEASWRSGLFPRHESSSSPGNGAAAFSQATNEGLMASADAGTWDQPRQLLVDDSFRCLFPVHDEDQQQSQGLSLSLYKPEPEASPAADFHRSFSQQLPSNLRDGCGSLMFTRAPSAASHQQQNLAFHHDREFFPAGTAAAGSVSHRLRLSKYLIPAQELLNEFCDLGGVIASKQKLQSKRVDEGGPSSSSPFNPSLQTLDILELQKRKAKLLTLLEEVDRRYRRYCEQMRAVVSSFEAVAGEGAATAYLALASKAMSRHFRSLRDGIVDQVQAAKKAMGEKDPIAPGISRGETPRLKVLDQCFRHQKAFQQGGIMEHHPWRPQRGLPERSVSILRAWLFEHFLHPYPSDVDKHILARQTGLSRSQVSNWFINARVRLWKPMIEEMYSEEMREHEDQAQIADGQRDDSRNPKPSCSREGGNEEQKPPSSELLSEPDSLSSIINAGGRNSEAQTHANQRSFHHQAPVQRTAAENFGVVDIDFSSYSSHSYNGNGVSLTLGLQQHDGGGGGGMEFSLSPANQQSIFYSRGQMEECQPVQFSVLDSEVQNLPYRNLMGAQLLHDLAG